LRQTCDGSSRTDTREQDASPLVLLHVLVHSNLFLSVFEYHFGVTACPPISGGILVSIFVGLVFVPIIVMILVDRET